MQITHIIPIYQSFVYRRPLYDSRVVPMENHAAALSLAFVSLLLIVDLGRWARADATYLQKLWTPSHHLLFCSYQSLIASYNFIHPVECLPFKMISPHLAAFSYL